jgi:hypothetical protein
MAGCKLAGRTAGSGLAWVCPEKQACQTPVSALWIRWTGVCGFAFGRLFSLFGVLCAGDSGSGCVAFGV